MLNGKITSGRAEIADAVSKILMPAIKETQQTLNPNLAQNGNLETPPMPVKEPSSEPQTSVQTPAQNDQEFSLQDDKRYKLKDGRVMTGEEIRNGWMRERDYTQKTQGVAKKRKELEDKYSIYVDLDTKMKNNPRLNDAVMTVYNYFTQNGTVPAFAHDSNSDDQTQERITAALDTMPNKDILEMRDKITQIEKNQFEREVQVESEKLSTEIRQVEQETKLKLPENVINNCLQIIDKYGGDMNFKEALAIYESQNGFTMIKRTWEEQAKKRSAPSAVKTIHSTSNATVPDSTKDVDVRKMDRKQFRNHLKAQLFG